MSIPICRVNVYNSLYVETPQPDHRPDPQYTIKGDYEYNAATAGLFSEGSLGLSSAKIDFGGSFIDVSLTIPLPNHMIVEANYSAGPLYDLLRYDKYWSIEYGWGDKKDKSTFSMHNMMIRDFSLDYDTSNRFFNLKIDLAPRLIQILRNINLIHCHDIISAVLGAYDEDPWWKVWGSNKDDPYNGPSVAHIISAVLDGAREYVVSVQKIVGSDYSGDTEHSIRNIERYRVWSWPKELKINRDFNPRDATIDYSKIRVAEFRSEVGPDVTRDYAKKFYFEKIEPGKDKGVFIGLNNPEVDGGRILTYIRGRRDIPDADGQYVKVGDKKIPVKDLSEIRKIGVSNQLNSSLVTANPDEIPKLSDFYFTIVGSDETIVAQKEELISKRTNDWERVKDNLKDGDYLAGTSLYAFLDQILKDNGYILCFTPGLYESGKSSVKQLVIPANVDPSISTNEVECTLTATTVGASAKNKVFGWKDHLRDSQTLHFGGKQIVEFEEVDYFNLHSMKNVILSVTLDATGGKKTIATVRSEEALVAGVDNSEENKNPPAKDIEIYDFLTKLAKSVTMKTIGIPHIRPWDVVNFTALGDLFTGRYRVITASHNISNGTYETELELMETVMPKEERFRLGPISSAEEYSMYPLDDILTYVFGPNAEEILSERLQAQAAENNRQAQQRLEAYVRSRGGGRL